MNGLKLDPRSSRGVRSAPLFALIRNLATRRCCSGPPWGVLEGLLGLGEPSEKTSCSGPNSGP
eukprot:13543169-Alexandrium_andersonii.AAC.1